MSNNLNNIATKTAKSWKVRAKDDRINRRNISRAQRFALSLLEYMDTHNLKQVDLAHKMNVKPQQVSKILRAKENLTFETIDKIEVALGVHIPAPTIQEKGNRLSKSVGSTMQIVHRRHNKNVEIDASTAEVTKTNAVLDLTLEKMNEYQNIIGQN
ncbi:MAG: hypothetical protein CMC70_03915 [Flavobacteriaceae bacterium]|nr:hypothetical protein [Flavobacteriaceae bacterium]|tara:strand:+ start:252 stop:719 length:468 start_codon:yes stop_codon:yes gene_type:complete